MRRNVALAWSCKLPRMRTFSWRAVEARLVLCFAVGMGVAHGLRSAWVIMRNVFAREALEAEPEAPPRAHRAQSLARALFEIEPLPEEPAPPRPRRRDALRALAARDALGVDPEPPRPPRGRGALRALLAPEPLPEDPVEPPRPSPFRWLSWLLRPEPLDPP